jgi:thiosulfate dehydrogenase (quinone) large subunit
MNLPEVYDGLVPSVPGSLRTLQKNLLFYPFLTLFLNLPDTMISGITMKEPPTRQQTIAQPTMPVAAPTPRQARWKASSFLLPLHLFLGITFVYAGIQKLTDPQYFNASAPGYIGKQIAVFTTGSPMHGFLMRFVVPHAHFFGTLVAYGEIAIGLGVLVGLLLRPASFFGLLLSLVFFFTATWHVYPYFYGADIVFVFCWITLLLAGPLHSGLPSLDSFLVPRFLQSLSQEQRTSLRQPLRVLIGVGDSIEEDSGVAVGQAQNEPAGAITL